MKWGDGEDNAMHCVSKEGAREKKRNVLMRSAMLFFWAPLLSRWGSVIAVVHSSNAAQRSCCLQKNTIIFLFQKKKLHETSKQNEIQPPIVTMIGKKKKCWWVTSVPLLTSAYQTHNPFLTLACNSLSWETVAIIFMAITLIRGKHTDGVVSQTHELRIKMSSLPELVMVWGANAL